MLGHTTVNQAVCAAAASDPQLLATDLADYLVRKGRPFRHAHHAVGTVVALAEKLGKPLNALTLAEFQSADAAFGKDVHQLFDLKKAMSRRNLTGAPGTREVARQLARWNKFLG
jgi:argininosuccinate lyase